MSKLTLIIFTLSVLFSNFCFASDNCADGLKSEIESYLGTQSGNKETLAAQALFSSVKDFTANRPIKEVRRLAQFFSKNIGFRNMSLFLKRTSGYVKGFNPIPADNDSRLQIQLLTLSDSKLRLATQYLYIHVARDLDVKSAREKLINLEKCSATKENGTSDKKPEGAASIK